jgi:hypothetical protein
MDFSFRNLNTASIFAVALAITCIVASVVMTGMMDRNMATQQGSDGSAGTHRDFYK